MKDYELLEMAAKAAGLRIRWFYRDEYAVLSDDVRWNPLTDDGDAFRLAVKLHMSTERIVGSRAAGWLADHRIEQLDTGDQCETLRRAIVRAAAKIGKSME